MEMDMQQVLVEVERLEETLATIRSYADNISGEDEDQDDNWTAWIRECADEAARLVDALAHAAR